jgi:quinol monooxygenase YgiN
MIRHIVLIRFRADISEERVSEIFADLRTIKSKVPGVLAITAGRSEGPEKIERGFMHGFVADFADWAALDAYQKHPDHRRVGDALIAGAVGGLDGILVFDLPVSA